MTQHIIMCSGIRMEHEHILMCSGILVEHEHIIMCSGIRVEHEHIIYYCTIRMVYSLTPVHEHIFMCSGINVEYEHIFTCSGMHVAWAGACGKRAHNYVFRSTCGIYHSCSLTPADSVRQRPWDHTPLGASTRSFYQPPATVGWWELARYNLNLVPKTIQ
jgi:hypothetical protein